MRHPHPGTVGGLSEPRVSDYRDVADFAVDDDKRERLFAAQTEATVMWTSREGWPVGVLHRYVWHDGRFWITCAEHRKRVAALRARPLSSISVSSEGTSLGSDINVVAKTRARYLEAYDRLVTG